MTDWEYRKIDLNQQRPRSDELFMLHAAGAEGWELVGITSNNIAYLKRPSEQPTRVHQSPPPARGVPTATAPMSAEGVFTRLLSPSIATRRPTRHGRVAVAWPIGSRDGKRLARTSIGISSNARGLPLVRRPAAKEGQPGARPVYPKEGV
jgi:hypothetical protein